MLSNFYFYCAHCCLLLISVISFDPQKYKGMMEKIRLSEAMGNLPILEQSDYVYSEKGNNIGKLPPSNLPYPNTGSGIVKGKMTENKWYRIAIGATGNDISSTIVNIGKMYNRGSAGSKLLYVSAEGYSYVQKIVLLDQGGGLNISKARILYKGTTTDRVMLDVYVVSTGTNDYRIAYSNNINFSFQVPEEVSETTPEGYSVKEFTL